MSDIVTPQAPVVTPFSATWPARTWTPAERVTAGMMNGVRDQLNELHGGGVPQNVPFSAGNFSALAPMVWTVGSAALIRNRYVRAGNLLWWSIYVSWFSGGNVLSGSPSASIYINIPGLYNGATSQIKSVDYVAGIAGVSITGGLTVTTLGSTYVAIEKADRSNFALTDIPGFLFGMWLEVG